MKVTNTSSFSSSVQALNNKTPAKNQQAKAVAPNEQQIVSEKTSQRIDNNKQVIELLDKQTQFGQAKNNNENINIDQPSDHNLNAVNTYQSVNNLTQREKIQSMLGVDLFA